MQHGLACEEAPAASDPDIVFITVRRGDLSASEVEGSAEATEAAETTEAAEAEDFSGLTVKELKAVLRSRGLSVSGRKAELLARLRAAA